MVSEDSLRMLSDSSPSTVVDAFIGAVGRREIDLALSMVAVDVEYDNVPMGKVFGPDGIREILTKGALAGADALEWLVLHQVATGNCVMNERLDRFHLDGRWIEVAVAGLFIVREEKIELWRDYFDLSSFSRQLHTA